jgi:DNA-binding GntR family transcriptional regulator
MALRHADLTPARDQRLADTVAQRLRDDIHAGLHAPGARLVERALARQLQVSHIPIREALTRLEEEGLVVRHPRRGARVAVLSVRTLEEISTLRAQLESFVARRVQERWSPAVEAELRTVVADMRRAAEAGDLPALLTLDQRFHERLWRHADHQLLLEVTAQLRGRVRRFLSEATATLDRAGLVAHAATHGEIVDALSSGSPAAVDSAVRRHVEAAARRIRDAEGLT